MAHFGQFLAKMAKTLKIIKKALGTFFSRLQALTNCKVSEKNNERFPRRCSHRGLYKSLQKVKIDKHGIYMLKTELSGENL